MPLELNRRAFQQLIDENIEAMKKTKQCFIDNDVLLEWDHIITCPRHMPDLYYGVTMTFRDEDH